MKNMIEDLINANSPISSKRFISLVALVLFGIVVIASLFGVIVQELIIYGLLGLILGGSALTLAGKENKIDVKDE